MVLDVDCAFLDVELVNQVHLDYGHTNLWVYDLRNLFLYLLNVNLLSGHAHSKLAVSAIKDCPEATLHADSFYLLLSNPAPLEPDQVLKSIEEVAPGQGLPIIGPVRGLLLDETVKKHSPSAVLEVGTLVGYSTIRMGRLLKKGGRITCVEVSDEMAKVARANIKKAGLSDRIEIIVGDAKEVLPKLRGSIDMVFLDAVKDEYLTYLRSCERLLHPGSVVVADNVKSHANDVADYLDYVRNSGKFSSSYHEAEANYRYGAQRSEPDAVEISVRL